MNAQKITQRLYESFASDDLCEHPEIVDDVEDLADEYEDLKAENAKLRDLVADMSKAFLTLDIDYCQACPRDKDNRRCQMFVTADGECAFVTEMRKLGIEVNDGDGIRG